MVDPSLSPVSESPTSSRRRVYVVPPHLSPSQKSQYRDISEDGVLPFPVDEVVGEVTDHKGRAWYFARFKGGIIRGFPAKIFVEKHKGLVGDFEKKRAAGLIPEFDPSTNKEVHPEHRFSMTLKLDMKEKRVTNFSVASLSSSQYQGDVEIISDSDEGDSDGVTDEDTYTEAESEGPPHRRTRAQTKDQLLSPRKLRSRKVHPIDDDGTDGSVVGMTLRRSGRNRKAIKLSLDDDAYQGESQAEDSDDYIVAGSSKSKAKPKKRVYKAVRPAYGEFRSMDEVDEVNVDPLVAHRPICEKCLDFPTNRLLASLKKGKGKGKARRRGSDEEESDEEERLIWKGGWQEEILKAARQRDRKEWLKARDGIEDVDMDRDGPAKRDKLQLDQTTDFICGACMKGGFCMGCMETVLEPNSSSTEPSSIEKPVEKPVDSAGDIAMEDGTITDLKPKDVSPKQLLFRCLTCKRLAHYEHLVKDRDPDDGLAEIARSHHNNWLCSDCVSYKWRLDKILAWRPYPPNAVEPPRLDNEPVNYKAQLPREYLVKWQERGYGRTQWVPHMWLLTTNAQKLRNFILEGPKVRLLSEPQNADHIADAEGESAFDPNSRESSIQPGSKTSRLPHAPLPDAESRIPLPWKTVDRVLDIQLRRPLSRQNSKKKGAKKRVKTKVVIESETSEDEESQDAYEAAYNYSEEPQGYTETLGEFEKREGRPFGEDDTELVIWGYFKWDDLASNRRRKDDFFRHHKLNNAEDLDLGQDPKLKLMDFQVQGFNWLCDNWWNCQPCILADEMGLGKTVQIASFIGKVITSFNAAPALVVVPNSTVTNWVREFERWAPKLRVVPFYGEAKSREVVKAFELYHDDNRPGMKTKFHVLITTYDTVTNKAEFTPVFKNQPRWEVLVIDEGQRLKSDSSLLFKKLNELKTAHRVIMTGTPLNNNIRELFNLMNFLDPNEWSDLEALEKEHEELTEELIKQLHERLRPYFLRRIKSQVLRLPPKNEVIVPVTMAPLQKQVYRSILSKNVALLASLTNPSASAQNSGGKKTVNNMLMQLRKCLQHPYLYDQDIEPRTLSIQETHEKLIDASAKLRFLRILLPKLKARGHRVLLFSQFVIALDVIEDFLVGEGIKYLRLDGNTAGAERQKGMDEFNKAGSDIFMYLLTTRAGGVGINLFTADTVIIFDMDFNPHQDLQAIARAHRFGQQKPVLVFKLVVKDSAEERIMQIGKKKMVLDHLIVQKMEDEDDAGGDLQSILMYGAKALFDEEKEGSNKDIVYSETDIDNLIEKTEKEGDAEEAPKEGALTFSFAKIWTSDKDRLEEVHDEEEPQQQDSWAMTLQKINADMEAAKAKEAAQSGRGVRRKAANKSLPSYIEDVPMKLKKSKKSRSSDGGSVYHGSQGDDVSDSDSEDEGDPEYKERPRTNPANIPTPMNGLVNGVHIPSVASVTQAPCGLCGQVHDDSEGCMMLEKSENLAEFREMLIMHSEDEPWEQRVAAIRVIEETLMKRGHLHLIRGQPLHPIRPPATVAQRARQTVPPNQTLPVAGPSGSSSKRSSPGNENVEQPKKKVKQHQSSICPVCQQTFHLLKDCPVVLQGPQSVSKAILSLDNTPGMSDVTEQLRKVLRRQRKEMQRENGVAQAGPSNGAK
uniref:Putative SNF2 family DNA-dependent ATPase n=1 Tax=Moniliophthora roreri TaxID=221103 RepID=A0A0W0FGI3_MONRR